MSTKKNQNVQTQLERAQNILLDLKPNITASDRDEAEKELNLSTPTVNRYLTGDAKNIDTALDLIEFFQRKILEREKKLQGAA